MKEEKILLAHGGGGKLMQELIKNSFLAHLKSPLLAKLDDSATFSVNGQKLAFTTDSYVVNPIFFRGGDIGKLAVCGTANDLAMSGAKPLYLSLSLIIEEGFPKKDLEKIISSAQKSAKEAAVEIIAGDTKVVNKGSADKIFVTTSGVGIIKKGINISSNQAKVGDKIILSGSIGDHGIAILAERENLNFKTNFKSDCTSLNKLVQEMLSVSKNIRCLRDPTRGGLATTLNEFAEQSNVGIAIEEDKIPLREEVKSACEMLGFDPLYIANEGKLVAIVDPKNANKIVAKMKKNKTGKEARIIGEVIKAPKKQVLLKTAVGGTRIVDTFSGEQLPRIC